MARKIQHHFPDSNSLCVRPAGTGSQLVYYPSQITRTASCALYQHPMLRNNTIYSLHHNNIRYNSISGLLCYFTGRLHNNFIIHQNTRLLLSRVHVRLNNPPCHRSMTPPVRRQSPTTITRGCHATSDHCLWPVPRPTHNPQP